MAPPGSSRLDLARSFEQEILYGFKSLSLEVDDRGEWLGSCELLPSYRVGQRFTLVDDFSIHQELDKSAPAQGWRAIFDDARLALLAEGKLLSQKPESLLAQMVELFAGKLEEPPDLPQMRTLYDPAGHLVAVIAPYAEERERVCEVVTRPLTKAERRRELQDILQRAVQLGFQGACEGAVHVHFDGQKWRDSGRLCRLILAWEETREELLQQWMPNPVTASWRGPFPQQVLQVARQGQHLPFEQLCLQLAQAGVRKRSDLNLLGLIRPRHRQVTLEARVFPVHLEVDELLHKVEQLEAFLGLAG